MTTTPIRITGVDFAYIPVTDFERAKRFYGDVLGLEQSKRYGKMPGGEFETGTLTLQLLQAEAFGQQFNRNPNPIAFHVDDVHEARAHLESQGIEFLGETMDSGVCHMAVFQDPDGHADAASPIRAARGASTGSRLSPIGCEAGFQRAQGMSADGVVTRSVELTLRKVVASAEAKPATGTTRINSDGTATAPAGAPPAVQQAIAAANKIIDTSYCVGGGHGSFSSSCYDCSGAVSFALHGAGLLSSSEDSTGLESFGSPGRGRWITVYADASHAFIVIGGRAFDTADYGGPNIPSGDGPRWRSNPLGNLQDGGNYVVRHPAGM